MVYAAVARTRMSVETIYNAVIRIIKPVNWVNKAVIRSKVMSKAYKRQ